MKTTPCKCGNTLFFDSTQCLGCGAVVGVCGSCSQITHVRTDDDGLTYCGQCDSQVAPCLNRTPHGICNVWTASDDPSGLCRYCRLTTVIPDLTAQGNIDRWRVLEGAKRRVLFGAASTGFPIDCASGELPLTFEFKADGDTPVATGHLNGCITINLREADPVEREKTRVEFGEPQRTLVGHFRHELGHYYWDRLVAPQHLDAFRRVFGNESEPCYESAKQRYYTEGPPANWQHEFISAYASMHPWEDFAESFGALLDMSAVVATALHFRLAVEPISDKSGADLDFDGLMKLYHRVGIVANELNRDMGLLDLVPEVFNVPARRKLQLVHRLARLQHDMIRC